MQTIPLECFDAKQSVIPRQTINLKEERECGMFQIFKWISFSLVTMVTDKWPSCREFEPSAAENPLRKGAMHVKSVESSNVLPLVWCDN
ncbi:hypothetical protein TNCV_4928111 [Trichonephila clavipes]|nr:hypothetical protein TNCV_4928111 [Trichonephila clavipes]